MNEGRICKRMRNNDDNFFACMESRFFIFKKKGIENFFATELNDYVSKEEVVDQEFVSYKINLENLERHFFKSGEYVVSEEAKTHYESEQPRESKEKSKEGAPQIEIIVWKDEYALIVSSVFVNAKEEPSHTDGLYRGESISVIEEECRNKNLFYIRKIQNFDFEPELDGVCYKIENNLQLDDESCYLSVLFDLMQRKGKDGSFVFNKENEYILGPIKSTKKYYSKKIQEEMNIEKAEKDEFKKGYSYRLFLLQIKGNSKFDKDSFYKSAIEKLDQSNTAFNSSCEFVFSDESVAFSFPNSLYLFYNLKEAGSALGKEDYYHYFLAFGKILLKKIDFFFIAENYKNKITNSKKIKKKEMEEIHTNFNEIKLFKVKMQQKVLNISPSSIANLWYQKTSTNVFVKNLEGFTSQLIENYKMEREQTKNTILWFISASAILSVICDVLSFFSIDPSKIKDFWELYPHRTMLIVSIIWTVLCCIITYKSKR